MRVQAREKVSQSSVSYYNVQSNKDFKQLYCAKARMACRLLNAPLSGTFHSYKSVSRQRLDEVGS